MFVRLVTNFQLAHKYEKKNSKIIQKVHRHNGPYTHCTLTGTYTSFKPLTDKFECTIDQEL